MAKLEPGAVTIDLVTGGIYGDPDHCPREDLLESAEALLSLLPSVQHKGLWGLAKAYDAECWLYTKSKGYEVPEGLHLVTDISMGPGCPFGWRKPFRLCVSTGRDRGEFWRFNWYEPLIGSVRDGKVSPDTEGITDLTAEARAEMERQIEEIRRREASKPRQLKMEL
jgi:hypothetical protein